MEKGTPFRCRCPKCRSLDVDLFECFIVRDLYEIRGGQLEDRVSVGDTEATGEVEAECVKCRHRWRPRGNPIQAASETT